MCKNELTHLQFTLKKVVIRFTTFLNNKYIMIKSPLKGFIWENNLFILCSFVDKSFLDQDQILQICSYVDT